MAVPTPLSLQSHITAQAYAELQRAFDDYNERLFEGSIPPCLITLQREKRSYGYFSHRRFAHRTSKAFTDEIAINPSFFGVVPLLEILQTVAHEMCHSWQFHHGTPGRRGYHNKEWADKMEAIGLMPSSTGAPGGARTGEHMADYAIAGGRFLAATDELLATGFQVSWIDRFPVRPPAPPVSVLLSVRPPFEEVDHTLDLDDDGDTADAPLPSLPPELAELAGLVEMPEPVDRSNRVKYRCPTCSTQVWGKPGLRILCGGESCEAVAFAPVQPGCASAGDGADPKSMRRTTARLRVSTQRG